MEDLGGISDLIEDFGEQNHQDEAKADRHLGCVQNILSREMIKSKEEVQTKDLKVQATIIEIKEKWKKGPSDGTEVRQAAKKQRQLNTREDVLARPTPVGKMNTLRELHTIHLKL
jgi:hypothetical protein